MNQVNKVFGLLAAVSMLSAGKLAAQNSSGAASARTTPSIEELLGDPVIAKGKGFEIKRSRLDEQMAKYQAQLVEQGTEIPPARLSDAEAGVTDYLIESAILNLQATDEQKKRGAADAEKQLAALKKRRGSDDAYLRWLRAIHSSPELFQKRLVEDTIRNTVLHDHFRVPEDKVKKYFEDNPSKFVGPERARVLHIYVSTIDPTIKQPLPEDERAKKRQKIEALLKRARAGEDFAKLALDNSEDNAVKDDKGEITILHNGRSIYPEFEAAVFTMQTNQISDVITSQVGFHVIKLLERTPGKKLELADASTDIRDFLEQVEIGKSGMKYLEQLEKENNVEIVDPGIKRLRAAMRSFPKPADFSTNPPSGISQ